MPQYKHFNGHSDYKEKFVQALADDLNVPEALAVVWELVKSNLNESDKYLLLVDFDQVLGLGLSEVKNSKLEIPKTIKELAKKREELRKQGKFEEADKVRVVIESKGYNLPDFKV